MACQILLVAADRTSPDPAIDKWLYKLGDPVCCFDDPGFEETGVWTEMWGDSERLPYFWHIRIPDRSAADIEPLIAEAIDPETGNPLQRRRFCGQGTPILWQLELRDQGYLVRTWDELLPYIIDKYPELPPNY